MPFLTRQFYVPVINSLSLFWLVLVLGTIVFAWRKHWRKALGLGILTLLVAAIGNLGLAATLLAGLEAPFVREGLDRVPRSDAVVMLGGLDYRMTLNDLGVYIGPRAMTAVELVRQGKADNLVLSGSIYPDKETLHSTAELVQQWITRWKLVATPIFNLPPCRNTHEEALRVKELADSHGWKRILLVTSANHMRRARAVFEKAGVSVVPVACDFIGHNTLEKELRFFIFPTPSALVQLDHWMYEKVGWWYYYLRGWIN
jgi:uncharacterized SAM-binding protein YcdF (DUF218 family)